MAVDKKSDYVGNHGGRYTDIDGISKQFTYIDHDKKTKVGINYNSTFNKQWEALEKEIRNHPICEKFLIENDLEWGLNLTWGHLLQIKELIDGTGIQTDADRQDT
jgi:hypothetical protein